MKLPIITTLLQLFAPSPDLCAEPYLDITGTPCTDSIGQTLSRYCEWSGPDVPVLDRDVCCSFAGDSAACWLPASGSGCASGSVARYCEYGDVLTEGAVVCYQPFPSACDLGHCVNAPAQPPDVQADLICCNAGGCRELAVNVQAWDCEDNGGIVSWCADGFSNVDGTVTCFD